MYNILFYEDVDGNKPVEEFIDELDASALNRDGWRVGCLESDRSDYYEKLE